MPKPARIAAERIGEPPPESAQPTGGPAGLVPGPVPGSAVRPPSPAAAEPRPTQPSRGLSPKVPEPRREPARETEGSGRRESGSPEDSRVRRPESRRDSPPAAHRATRPEAEPRRDQRSGAERAALGGALGEAAAEALGRILALIDHDVSGRVYPGEERLAVEISGRDTRFFLEEHGRALFSLEHLLPKLIRGLSGEGVFLKVDCENFREDREEELRQLALEVADEVAETGRPETLDWLNPAERRIVHVALSDDPAVTTESGGSGYLKQLTVYPAGDRQDREDQGRHRGDAED